MPQICSVPGWTLFDHVGSICSEDSQDSIRWKEELARASPEPQVEYWKYGSSSEDDLDGGKKKRPAGERIAMQDTPESSRALGGVHDGKGAAEKSERLETWVKGTQKLRDPDVDVCRWCWPPS